MPKKYRVTLIVESPTDPTKAVWERLLDFNAEAIEATPLTPGTQANVGELWMLEFSNGSKRPYIFDSDSEWSGVSEDGDFNSLEGDDPSIKGGSLMWKKEHA